MSNYLTFVELLCSRVRSSGSFQTALLTSRVSTGHPGP